MADDVDIPVASSATVATDEIAGRHFQRIKLTDATADSTDPTGVAANPLTTEARLAFVDYDDSIVPVTDNGDNHWLPVTVRGNPLVTVDGVNGIISTTGGESPFILSGPSDGSWGIIITSAATGMLRLQVYATGGTPTVAAFGAVPDTAAPGSVDTGFDQQLPLIIPDGDSFILADSWTPGAGSHFVFIAAPAPLIEIRAVSGGTSDPVDASVILSAHLPPIIATMVAGTVTVVDGGSTISIDDGAGSITVDGTVAVSGTTAISASALPLPSGAATAAKQPALGTAGSASADVLSVQGIASGTALKVDGSAVTQPVSDGGGSLTVDGTVAVSGTTAVSAASLPLPSGAATAAKQPALGTAGTASTDVITVQGIASGTAQPVSDGGGSLTVDGIIVAAGFLSEDAAHSSGDGGFFGLTVRQSEANSLSSTAGTDGDYAAFTTDARGLLQVSARPYVSRIRVASSGLTIVTTAYTIGDTAGAIMTFAGAARVSGGTGTILAATLLDKGDVGADYRLHFYRASVTLSSDNTAWAVSDTDQESLIGIVTMPSMLDVGSNRVSTLAGINLPYDCAATSLFVGIETRSANAVYTAATDLNLILTVALD